MTLPELFLIEAPDDAMAPAVRKGQRVEFSTGLTPNPDDGVLVRDKVGNLYFRQFKPRRAGLWEAHPKNSAFLPLSSTEDGLEVVAVLTAVHGRWS